LSNSGICLLKPNLCTQISELLAETSIQLVQKPVWNIHDCFFSVYK
jgi:hypothetical protein